MLQSSSKRALFILATITSLVLACLAIEYFQRLYLERLQKDQVTEMQADFALLRSDLESELNASIYRSWGMLSFITAHPESTPEEWQVLSEELLRSAKYVRNIAVAPNNVVSFVYPQLGNEAVIGLDYRALPDQYAAVQRAILQRNMVVAGPVNLRQGGVGIITRMPIFTNRAGEDSYWGMVSIVLDIDSIYSAVDLAALQQQYRIAMQGRDGLGSFGETFMGTQSDVDNAEVVGTVRFGNGSWVLAMSPRQGSQFSWWILQRVRLIGYSFIFTLYLLLFGLFRLYRESYGDSMHDALTGIANRRLLMDRLRTLIYLHQRHPTQFALINIDLNNFKAINDRHGHQAGDFVLQQVAQRLKQSVRTADTVARVGGDEFLLLMVGISDEQTVTDLSIKLLSKINQPLSWKGRTIDIYAALGWSLFPSHAQSVDDLLQQADEMMYRQKVI